MENLDFIIIFGLIIFALYFIINNKKKIIKKESKINYSDVYVVTDKIQIENKSLTDNDIFYKNNFVKNLSDKEIKQINIEKGNITRQSIINESGGSTHYKETEIKTNISGNKINHQENVKSYRKLPTKLNK
jgi:hypothetical protein